MGKIIYALGGRGGLCPEIRVSPRAQKRGKQPCFDVESEVYDARRGGPCLCLAGSIWGALMLKNGCSGPPLDSDEESCDP